MKILNEKSLEEIAKKLYELSKAMYFDDYNEEKEINDIEECLYYLKAIAENEYNSDYFRTFYNTLQRL